MQILIIDDQAVNVKILDFLVRQSLGASSVNFTEPVKALEWCNDNTPDLVFVDYMMPVMDGLEFIRQFRKLKNKADIPVVMITAVDDRDIKHQALKLGANDFVNKPFDQAELLARSHNMLSLRKHQLEITSRADWLASEIKKATQEIIDREREIILRLTRATEYRSLETGNHIIRVALYSQMIAKQYGMSSAEQDLIMTASSMHDIGKVGTPDQILFKEGKLDENEFSIMKNHTIIGYEIMKGSSSKLVGMAAEIALAHHEKFDGSGYPNKLLGAEIPISARICAVSDVFDALTSERCYKQAWPLTDAINNIRLQSGSSFDPEVINCFIQIMPDILNIKNQFSDRFGPAPAKA